MDLFADARPNDRVRAYANARLTHNWTLPANPSDGDDEEDSEDGTADQLLAEAADLDVADIIADLNRRDQADSTREASPLRKAADAVEIDTSQLNIEQVVAAILSVVADRSGRQI